MNISELAKIEGCAEKLIYLLIKLGHQTPVELCNVAELNRIVLQRILGQLFEKNTIIKYKYGHYKCNPEVTVQTASPLKERKGFKFLKFKNLLPYGSRGKKIQQATYN
ncbi:MAG: hypothetical protein LBJ67_03340 [Planctomycetaceae bacterium]|jgi:hypothetical protein|nr:hypothetical protein [Planctomycetaceae bacterium]